MFVVLSELETTLLIDSLGKDYGLTGPWQNYMQNKRDDPRLPGALGLGQSTATSLNYFFTFFCYVTPVSYDSWTQKYGLF